MTWKTLLDKLYLNLDSNEQAEVREWIRDIVQRERIAIGDYKSLLKCPACLRNLFIRNDDGTWKCANEDCAYSYAKGKADS